MKSNKIICVVGPTASGKTGLGVRIAQEFNGEIISADSRQIYRGLDIGTGKDLNEYGNVKYHMIDICDPGEKFTVFDWVELAKKTIVDVQKRDKLPIIVGGTGLYIQALIEGFELKEIRNKKQRISNIKYSRKQLEGKPLKELREIYKKLKIENCELKIDINNPYRLIRAIEKRQSGDRSSKVNPDYDVLQVGIGCPREKLNKKIDIRVEEWFKEGFYKEAEGLLNKGVNLEWFNKIGLEYKILANYIRYQELEENNNNLEIKKLIENCKLDIENLSSFESMKEKMKTSIHQYAKRQMTWFKRFPEIHWVENGQYGKVEKIVSLFVQK